MGTGRIRCRRGERSKIKQEHREMVFDLEEEQLGRGRGMNLAREKKV